VYTSNGLLMCYRGDSNMTRRVQGGTVFQAGFQVQQLPVYIVKGLGCCCLLGPAFLGPSASVSTNL
jgi:hypothetical protein